jgi:hypothetical protein
MTVEKAKKIIGRVGKGSYCPADSCPRKDPNCISHDAICEREFLRWAESEVKENNAS